MATTSSYCTLFANTNIKAALHEIFSYFYCVPAFAWYLDTFFVKKLF